MAKKAAATKILDEDQLKDRIQRLESISDKIDALNAEWDLLAPAVIDTLGIKGIRQYDELKAMVQQNMNRGISWKKEAMSLARKLHPTAAEFRKYLVSLIRRHPKKPGKPFVRLYHIKSAEVEEV